MTNKAILKREERRWRKRVGPVTDDNIDTYPIGNPYAKKISKPEMVIFQQILKKHRDERDANKTPEEIAEYKAWVEENIKKWNSEDAKAAAIRKAKDDRKKVRRLFFK